MPRVTVIIPTFNYAEVLPYSIGSVLRQTFTDFELLVVGDHCTDTSESVVTSNGDPRVQWINLEKRAGHQSGPNNEGLKQARGELIAYLGHDDLWLPRHLELALKTIDSGADLSYGIIECVLPTGLPVFAPEELDYAPGMWIPPTGVVHRRSPAVEVGGWRHYCDIKDDMDPESELWLRLHLAGKSLRLTRMLTAVKFPAARRKGVYTTKPSHEQAAWTERIKTEPDFAAVELARLLRPVVDDHRPFAESAREFGADVLHRIRRRIGRSKSSGTNKTRAEIYAQRLKFKGVDPGHLEEK